MDRRAFLALVGAYASAGMLPTRKVSPAPTIEPGFTATEIHSLELDNAFVANERQMGWMVTQEVLNDDLYGNIAIGNQSEGIYLNG